MGDTFMFLHCVVVIGGTFFLLAYRISSYEKNQKEIEQMPITPMNIANVKFSHANRRGANRKQVYAYLKRISAELEQVTAERDALLAEANEYRRREREQRLAGKGQGAGVQSEAVPSQDAAVCDRS